MRGKRFAPAIAAFVLASWCAVSAADWPTFGADPARSGSIGGNAKISTSSVARLHRLWSTKLGDVADSAPIYLSAVHAGGKARPMLFVTAKDGTTYGVDADNGSIVWHFETHGPGITTSTPAADQDGRLIYVPGVDGFVHKLDAASGKERGGGFPVRITRMPGTEKDASSLNLANGYLYAATSGYFGDAPPYDGHVVAIRLSDGSAHVFNSLCSNVRTLPGPGTCRNSDSGIWSRGGVVVDPDPSMNGRIYAATGNGAFDANIGGDNYGDSVVALSADALHLFGYYTPSNYAELDSNDLDLGSTSPAMLPREPHSRTPLMAVQGGKDQILVLLDRRRLGGVGGELQRIDIGSELFAAPAVWSDGGRAWVFLGLPSGVRAYRLNTDSQGKSRLSPAWNANAGQSEEGTSPVVTNGAIFYASSGAVYALDARTGHQLWKSAIGDVHWQSPVVVNDRVYVADQDGRLTAFGL